MKNTLLFVVTIIFSYTANAKVWTEKCPQMEVENPYVFKRIWTSDKSWSKKSNPNNQVTLMSCGNWKVMGNYLNCYYGPNNMTYTQTVAKPILEGAKCERSSQCEFKCSKQKILKKLVPKIKVPKIKSLKKD